MSTSTQTRLRSVISKGMSAGVSRAPSTTFFTVTTPEMGLRSVRVRSTSPLFSRWSMASFGTSHSESRRRAASSRSPPLPCRVPPARACWVFSASRYSRWAATNSGL